MTLVCAGSHGRCSGVITLPGVTDRLLEGGTLGMKKSSARGREEEDEDEGKGKKRKVQGSLVGKRRRERRKEGLWVW